MVAPTLTVRIDFHNNGTFTDAIDSCVGRVLDCSWTRGASADFSGEATGSATLLLDNFDDRYTPDRNWHDGSSFEVDTTGWSVTAIASLTAAATSITKVVDNAPSAGTSAGEAVLTATLNSGVTYSIPYRFRSGITYAVSVYLKSISGNLNVRAGMASSGTPADIASSSANITTSWAQYTFTWTPSADRTDGVFFVRTTTAAAATLRIDAVQVNPGATANTYIEAPTKGQLVPGRPVHIYTTYSAVDDPQVYGFIERLTTNQADRTVSITCYDPLRRLQETDVVVAANSFVQRSARDMRIAVLDDFERGTRNLIGNPEFATDTTGWAALNGTITRTASAPPAPAPGSTYGAFARTSGTATLDHLIRLAPVFFAGQVYRFSVWLWTASGTLAVTLGIGEDSGVSIYTSKSVTATTTPTRHTITYTAPTTRSANSGNVLRPFLTLASGTVRLGGAAFTRGQALHPYSAAGTGRWPNWCGNGSFDGGALNGWYDGWTNLVGNPSFEVDTIGWSAAGDAFVTGGGTLTRDTTTASVGSASGKLATTGATSLGLFYPITGTFKAGVTYGIRIRHRIETGSATGKVGIGSQGTPTDKSELTGLSLSTTWTERTLTWTPSADRTDAHVYADGAVNLQALYVDAIQVMRRDAASASDPAYSNVGPGGSFVTTRGLSATAKYGSQSQQADTPATATAGRVYDFNHLGPVFVSGQPYTTSVWLRPTSNMPYRVGMAANKGDGTFDEASVTGTATANVWTQVTVTWTPSADRSSATAFDVVLLVYQTDAIARTFLIDGVRVIPGSAADEFEMAHWSLVAESDLYLTAASLAGGALAALNEINGYTLTRHWIEPTMASPWYTYMTRSRDDLATKVSSETYADDLADMSAADIDRASIINVVPVAYSGGTAYYSDADSVSKYGPRPTGTIGSANFFSGLTIPDAIGPALIARYKDPRARPTMIVVNRWPSQLQRELDDLITVTFGRLRISNGRYLILRLDTKVTEAGQRFETTYALEEHSA